MDKIAVAQTTSSGNWRENIEKAKQEKIKDIVQISKRAFESDVFVGGVEKDSPPDYDSVEWHEKMLEGNHLFQAILEDTIVVGAILFLV